MTKNIFAELRASYGFLTRAERQLADLILEQPDHLFGGHAYVRGVCPNTG